MHRTRSSMADHRVFRVSGGTSAVELGAAVAHAVDAGRTIELCAIGASAVNQAAKSIPIAQGYVAQRGVTLLTTIRFEDADVQHDGEAISRLVFTVEGVGGWGTNGRRERVLSAASSTALQ